MANTPVAMNHAMNNALVLNDILHPLSMPIRSPVFYTAEIRCATKTEENRPGGRHCHLPVHGGAGNLRGDEPAGSAGQVE